MTANGRLRLHAIPAESFYRSVTVYNLQGSQVQARFVTPPPAADASANLRVTDGTQAARISWNNGTTPTITADFFNGTSWATLATVTFNPATHGFWRLRADTNGVIYHDTAPTSVGPWTTLHSGNLGWNPGAVTVILGSATTTTPTGGWAEFDDVNIAGQSVLDTGSSAEQTIPGPADMDTGTGAEPAPTISLFVTLADTGTGTQPTPAISTTPAADVGLGSDILQVAGAIIITDSGTGTEPAPGNTVTLPADTGTGTETTPTRAVTLPDQGTGVDTAIPAVNATGTDLGAGVELTPAITVTVADPGNGVDAQQVTASLIVETGVGVDTPTIARTAVDNGLGADTLIVAVTIPAADTGTGADAQSVTTQAVVGDTGTGTEPAPGIATAIPANLGNGADTAAPAFTVTDLATGAETVARSIVLVDTGAGTDAQTLVTGNTQTKTDTGSGDGVLTLNMVLLEIGTGVDTTHGPGSVLPNFVRSYVRSTAGRTFVRSLERFPVWPTAL